MTNSSRGPVDALAKCDTGLVPRAARLEFWNRVNTECFSEISVDARSETLHGVLERRQRGALKIARVYSSAVVVHGGRLGKCVTRAGGLLLHMQDLGTSLNTQLKRSTRLRPGDITFCDAGRPYKVECADPVQMIVINIPYELLSNRFSSIDEFVALHVDGTRGAGAILASLVRNVWQHCSDLETDPETSGKAVISAVLDLMGLVHARGTEPGLSPGVAALRRAMQAHVEHRLADPTLSVSSLADAFGVTTRHVHRVFAESGATPSNYILERRLDLTARRLRDLKRGDNVTTIAYDSGFTNLASFSRSFRKRYGVTPRDYRRAD